MSNDDTPLVPISPSELAAETDNWTGIPGIIQDRWISPPDPQVFADLDLSTVRQRLQPEDFRALTPLFYGHINPYGLFELDLEGLSFLEAA